MPVVTFSTTKGGSGKTTSAAILASVLVDADASVVMLDADPNQPLVEWAQDGTLPDNLTVIGNINEENIVETIEEESRRADFVIVDLEGSANLATSYAMSVSDLILIPLYPSSMDAKEAGKTMKLVERQRRAFKTRLNCRVFYSRVSGAIKGNSFTSIEQQFADAQIPTMQNRVIDREAYRAMFDYGSTLMQLTRKEVSSIDKADANARDFAGEVLQILSEEDVLQITGTSA